MRKLILLLTFFTCLASSAQNLTVTVKGTRFGVKEADNWVLSPDYDTVIQLSNNLFIIKQKGLFGYFVPKTSTSQARKSACRFTDYETSYNEDYPNTTSFAMKKKHLFAMYDYTGKRWTRFEFEEVKMMEYSSFCRRPGEKWNLIDNRFNHEVDNIAADSVIVPDNHLYGYAFAGKQPNQSYDKIIYVDIGSPSEYKYNPDWGRRKIFAESRDSHLGYYYRYPVNESGYLFRADGGYKTVTSVKDGMWLVYRHDRRYDLLDSNFASLLDNPCLELEVITDHYIQKGGLLEHSFLPGRSRLNENYSLYDFKSKDWVYQEVYLVKKLGDRAVLVREFENSTDMVYFTDVKKEYNLTWFTSQLFIAQLRIEKGNNLFHLYKSDGALLGIPSFYSYQIQNGELLISTKRENPETMNYKVTADGFILER